MYVPVMKNRTVEVGVLQKLSAMHVFDGSIIPLVEQHPCEYGFCLTVKNHLRQTIKT